MATKINGITLDTTMLDKITAELRPRASDVVQTYGILVASDYARGVPVISGNLKNSITSESHLEQDLLYIAQDGTEYGARVELGFHGEDSLGRNYNQAAQPALVPAVEKWREKFYQAFETLFK